MDSVRALGVEGKLLIRFRPYSSTNEQEFDCGWKAESSGRWKIQSPISSKPSRVPTSRLEPVPDLRREKDKLVVNKGELMPVAKMRIYAVSLYMLLTYLHCKGTSETTGKHFGGWRKLYVLNFVLRELPVSQLSRSHCCLPICTSAAKRWLAEEELLVAGKFRLFRMCTCCTRTSASRSGDCSVENRAMVAINLTSFVCGSVIYCLLHSAGFSKGRWQRGGPLSSGRFGRVFSRPWNSLELFARNETKWCASGK